MWVKFTSRFCWKPNAGVSIVFKPDGGPFNDGRYPVTRDCAEQAKSDGAAVKAVSPNRRVR